ncbi:MAG: hypothetical protein L6R37_007498 [Teloschistes peruensis]|nr:MAG: hypothetical protein L6R37_007498 [Teloschistes peruensis]
MSEVLTNFIKAVKDAPKLARRVFSEVEDLTLCFQRIQDFVSSQANVDRSRAAMITVDQLLVVLTNCVTTFSELENALGGLTSKTFSPKVYEADAHEAGSGRSVLQVLRQVATDGQGPFSGQVCSFSTANAGKSTVLKQLQMMQGTKLTEAEIMVARHVIYFGLLKVFRHILQSQSDIEHNGSRLVRRSSLGPVDLEVCDVGGARAVRKKLIQFDCMEDLDYAIYVADLNGYCQYLQEDLNVMWESLQLFENLLNLPELTETTVFLFLNKADLFETTILREPILDYFPDYTGGADCWKGTQYFPNKFAALDRRPGKQLHCHVTDSLDTPSFQKAWELVEKKMIHATLKI